MAKHRSKVADTQQNVEQSLREAAEDITSKNIIKKPLSNDLLPLEETKKLLYELEVQKIELEIQNEELRAGQEELFNLNKRYMDLYHDAPVGYMTLNSDNKIVESNNTLHRLLEEEGTTLFNQPLENYILNEDQDIYYLFCRNVSKGKITHSCILRMIKKNGTPFYVNITSKQTKADDDSWITYLVINDISDKKRDEASIKAKEKIMLVQSRFAIIGEMINMIAHQWRQPLTAISARIATLLLKQELGKYDKDDFTKQLNGIDRSIHHMSETIYDFRNFFKDDKVPVKTTFSKLVDMTLEIINPILQQKQISLETEFLNDEEISTYQNEIKQVILNIINNAQEVITEREVHNPSIKIKGYKDKDMHCIEIQDNAGGIPVDIIDKIFDPYFTTKASFNGTGLGLYMSKVIIEEHCRGSIKVKNSENGAKFFISIEDTRLQL